MSKPGAEVKLKLTIDSLQIKDVVDTGSSSDPQDPAIEIMINKKTFYTERKVDAIKQASYSEVFIIEFTEKEYNNNNIDLSIEVVNKNLFGIKKHIGRYKETNIQQLIPLHLRNQYIPLTLNLIHQPNKKDTPLQQGQLIMRVKLEGPPIILPSTTVITPAVAIVKTPAVAKDTTISSTAAGVAIVSQPPQSKPPIEISIHPSAQPAPQSSSALPSTSVVPTPASSQPIQESTSHVPVATQPALNTPLKSTSSSSNINNQPVVSNIPIANPTESPSEPSSNILSKQSSSSERQQYDNTKPIKLRIDKLQLRDVPDHGTFLDKQDPAVVIRVGKNNKPFETKRAKDAGVNADYSEEFEIDIDSSAFDSADYMVRYIITIK